MWNKQCQKVIEKFIIFTSKNAPISSFQTEDVGSALGLNFVE